MKYISPFLVLVMLLSACNLKKDWLSNVTYTNTQNNMEYAFYVIGFNDMPVDSLIKSLLLINNTSASLESKKLNLNESTNFEKSFRRNYRTERYINKLNKKTKYIRITSFTFDTKSQNYISTFDTTVVNSKDSVYYFHSR